MQSRNIFDTLLSFNEKFGPAVVDKILLRPLLTYVTVSEAADKGIVFVAIDIIRNIIFSIKEQNRQPIDQVSLRAIARLSNSWSNDGDLKTNLHNTQLLNDKGI